MSFALGSLLGHVTYLARSSKPGKSWGDAASALNTYRTPHRRHPLSGSAGCIPGGFSSPALLEGPGTTCPLQQKWCRNGLTRPPWSFCLLHNTCRGWERWGGRLTNLSIISILSLPFTTLLRNSTSTLLPCQWTITAPWPCISQWFFEGFQKPLVHETMGFGVAMPPVLSSFCLWPTSLPKMTSEGHKRSWSPNLF